LALMLNNKADFILEYNEKTGGNLKRDDVDWSQTRVLFLANSFTSYQMNAINFRDLPIELWEVKMYDNETILYNQLLAQEAKESIKTVSKNKTINSVSKEVKVYTVEDHLAGIEEETRNLFYSLREKVYSIKDDIEERPKKNYIAYRTQQAFVYVHLQKNRIKIHLITPQEKLDDPKNISRDVKNIGHLGGGVTEIFLNNEEELNYVFGLVEQSYKYLRK
jgi:predicted transport protein